MTRVRVHMMISLDGYTSGPNQSLERPFGDIPDRFLDWVFKLRSFRELLNLGEGGETGPTDDVMRETGENLGATVMGRNMFGGGPGPWSEDWRGWWGDNPPFHTPVFVVTHHPRAPLTMEGGTEFHFVTDGIESALRQAREAAGDRDIRVGGGGSLANQFLAAGLVDELELHVVPVILGAGVRLLDNLGSPPPQLELLRAVAGPEVTHVKYRLAK